MWSSTVDTECCSLCLQRNFDVLPATHTPMRWISIVIKNSYSGWHVGCGPCLSYLWSEMFRPNGSLDLSDMPPGKVFDYHLEWVSRIRDVISSKLVRDGHFDYADVEEMLAIVLARPLSLHEIDSILAKRNANSTAWFCFLGNCHASSCICHEVVCMYFFSMSLRYTFGYVFIQMRAALPIAACWVYRSFFFLCLYAYKAQHFFSVLAL